VGPQHLETFGSLEAVANTKYELIESLPDNGHAFFPHDHGICDQLYHRTEKNKDLFGFDDDVPLAMTAKEITVGEMGSTFTLVNSFGMQVTCHTALLGKHNIMNILGAASVAYELGLTLEEIARGIEKVKPVEHRLQIIPTGNGVTVIDDAFNASPMGTRAALDVLSQFNGRKIIITPGLVELGEREEAENSAFGKAMAKVVDIAVLVGKKRAEQIKNGLMTEGFNKGNIYVVDSLEKASEVLATFSQAGDVVLFENDLPDNY
jgi:UDP-N-acetylmuramoyl-tripeptide--D-alanyl-D-alanine ligase